LGHTRQREGGGVRSGGAGFRCSKIPQLAGAPLFAVWRLDSKVPCDARLKTVKVMARLI
jgi:hypothetical protein